MSRMDFYSANLSVEDLLLDTGNARIRTGVDQRDCIQKILSKEDQMLTLMQDIMDNGLTTMPILVSPSEGEKGKWLVWDGNRRVTALKLLSIPDRCPVEYLKPKIKAIIDKSEREVLTHVDCLCSDDYTALEKEVVHRHSGALGGAGQLDWDAYMKTVFSLNHGNSTQYKRAGQYLLWAESQGLVVEDSFPITSIHRFFTRENLNLLGFNITEDDRLEEIVPTITARAMALKLISDFGGGKPVRDVFKPEAARSYLAEVRSYAGLSQEKKPAPENNTGREGGGTSGDRGNGYEDGKGSSLGEAQSGKGREGEDPNKPGTLQRGAPDSTSPPPTTKGSLTPTWERASLFPRNRDGLTIPQQHAKAKNIVAELRRLKTNGTKSTSGTPIAVAMLLRALLEISTERYLSIFPGIKNEQDFHRKVARVADHMKDQKFISQEQHEVVVRHTRSQESMLHVKTIQKYVHSEAFHPTGQTLNSLWDEISAYVGACWRAQPIGEA